MNSILSQYLMRTIIASSVLVMIVLLALAGLFEFIAQLEDLQNNYEAPQAILYTALRLPNLASEMMPVAVLIGSLLAVVEETKEQVKQIYEEAEKADDEILRYGR